MPMIYLTIPIILIVPCILLFLYFLLPPMLHKKSSISPFECGFNPIKSAQLPFSLRFFLLSVIFMIFDIEVVLIMNLPVSLSYVSLNFTMKNSLIFMSLLILGLYHEWNEKTLNWKE